MTEITTDNKNARKHTDANLKVVEDSLLEFGPARSIVVDEKGQVIAGNATYTQAKKLGIPVEVVDAKGKLYAVRVSGLSEEQKTKLALVDNHATDLSSWEESVIAQLLESDKETIDTLVEYDKDSELAKIVSDILKEEMKKNLEDVPPRIEESEKLLEKWQVVLGDVWEVESKTCDGVHRIVCGDCTDVSVADRLMDDSMLSLFCTDAPYGVDYADKVKKHNKKDGGNRIESCILNDNISSKNIEKLLFESFNNARNKSLCGCPFYIFAPPGVFMLPFMNCIISAKWNLSYNIVWVKNNHVLSLGDYHNKHEMILYGWNPGAAHWFYGDRSNFSVWEFDKPHKSKLHPTTKPVDLIAKMIMNSSKKNELVGDWFLGSGTTLVACEQLGRLGRGIEIEPKYVSVALQRLQDIGLSPQKV